MSEFEKHKTNFFNFIDSIKHDDKVAIISHANCIDGMTSVIFMLEILKKKHSSIKPAVHFCKYGAGNLSKIESKLVDEKTDKVLILDLNADMDMIDELNNLRNNFDVLFIDHHPIGPGLDINNKVIKTPTPDCTSLVLFRFGEGLIDYSKWSWLVCATAISEFSHNDKDNLKFIQKYYPSFTSEDKKSDIFNLMNKINSLTTYYSKDSMKAYEIILNKNMEKIEEIHNEVNIELQRCLDDFEKNSEKHFDNKLYIHFFKSKFPLGSTVSTTLSVKHKGATIVVFSDIEGTPLVKVSARNNGIPLPYHMNDLLRNATSGFESATAGGHNPASGGVFLRKDIDRFKKNVLEFVKSKLN